MAFDFCQCRLIKAYQNVRDESDANVETNYSWSWTRISQLPVGRCRCSKYGIDFGSDFGSQHHVKEDIGPFNDSVPTKFRKASFKAQHQSSTPSKHCLDVYEMKRNVLETAFETAESIASLGAIVSVS